MSEETVPVQAAGAVGGEGGAVSACEAVGGTASIACMPGSTPSPYVLDIESTGKSSLFWCWLS